MEKNLKLHIKQEKRIVKLCFQKGLLHQAKIDLVGLGWESITRTRNGHYLPEVHMYTVDYFGEGDCNGLVDFITQYLFWENSIPNTGDESTCGYPDSTFRFKSRQWFISYLSELPTIFRSSRINRVLTISEAY